MKKPTLKKRLTFDPEESRSYVKIMLISGILLLAATLILLTVVKNAVEVEPGWYSVDSAEREDFPLYDSGIHFTYYFDGDSTAIRTEQKKLAAAYSKKLLEIRKLLDPKQSFGDLVNLAWLNAHPNQTATLDETLFDILRDAAAANATGPYAGALWSEWQTMIVSADAAAYDPLVDPDARARIRELADAANAPGAAMLELDETNHTACLRLSEDYLAAAEAGEYGPALDLGYLTEAYALLYVRAELEAEGWKTGYFTTDSGISLAMSAVPSGDFILPGLEGETPVRLCATQMAPGSAACALRTFAATSDEPGYYTVETAAGIARRHPNLSVKTGEVCDDLLCVWAVSEGGDLIAACKSAYAAVTRPGLKPADLAADPDLLTACVFAAEPATVYADAAHAAAIVFVSEADFRLAAY